MRDESIWLTGMMGSGKSSIGKELSKQLKWEFIDLDKLIEERMNLTVSEIFTKYGEGRFRAEELKEFNKIKDKRRAVIALGGGAVLNSQIRSAIGKSPKSIWLNPSAEVLAKRVSKNTDSRPLLDGLKKKSDIEDFLAYQLKQRKPFYRVARHKLMLNEKPVKDAASEIMKKINSSRESIINVKSQNREYSVRTGKNLLTQTDSWLPQLMDRLDSENVLIIYDKKLKSLSDSLTKKLNSLEIDVFSLGLKSEESIKSFEMTEEILKYMQESKLDRKSTVFAIGGGVIGDLTGFVSGIYMRGLPWVAVPTTLLSQIDSSVGGKTAINFRKTKNTVGLFNPPHEVICDTSVLKSLPSREITSALGEVIKYALIDDEAFLNEIESNWEKLLNLDSKLLLEFIPRCIEIKAKIVEADEKELKGVRELLNFGHTFGHALESFTKFKHFRHGEAVILGMRYALALSNIKKHLSDAEFERVNSFLVKIKTPYLTNKDEPVKFKKLKKIMMQDKKKKNGVLNFVLLNSVGRPFLSNNVSVEEMKEAFEMLGRF
jgi:3-dehydroquinate synthase